ncbi:MAG: hypothetical protein E5X76_17850 [Mesorhizobium sp.]|nr:MAG: hypothetical protein E5X76_17850 [Mesorhizobium sp.]
MTRNDLLTLDGVTQPIIEWALDYGIPAKRIMDRLQKGMTVEKAITKPIRAKPGVTLDDLDPTWIRGVVAILQGCQGTGGGSVAQDRAEIEFLDKNQKNPEIGSLET